MSTAWTRLRDRLVVPKEQPTKLFLSDNDKTGYSINLPIPLTCRPTAACAKYCYGTGGPIAFPTSLARQAQNWMRFEALATASQAEVNRETDRIAGALSYADQDFLRVFGVGDLQPGSVRFINTMSRRHPDIALWVATRQWGLAKRLRRSENIHLMLSTDATTLPKDWEAARKLVKTRGKTTFLAYVQQSPEDLAPKDVKVVFAEHKHGGRRGAWTATKPDVRTCPATVVDGTPHANACASCRFCFDERRRTGTPGVVQIRLTKSRLSNKPVDNG